MVTAQRQRDREAIERLDPGLIEHVIADWRAASAQRANTGVYLGLVFQTVLGTIAAAGVELSLALSIAIGVLNLIGAISMALPFFSKNKRILRKLLREAGLRPSQADRALEAILASRKVAFRRARAVPRKERAGEPMRLWVEATVRAVEGPQWQRAFRPVADR